MYIYMCICVYIYVYIIILMECVVSNNSNYVFQPSKWKNMENRTPPRWISCCSARFNVPTEGRLGGRGTEGASGEVDGDGHDELEPILLEVPTIYIHIYKLW